MFMYTKILFVVNDQKEVVADIKSEILCANDRCNNKTYYNMAQQEQMMHQMQQRRDYGVENLSTAQTELNLEQNTSAGQNNNTFTSFVNSQMRYDHNKSLMLESQHGSEQCGPALGDLKVMCLLSFIGCCDNSRMAFGPYCLVHNKLLFNRTFMATTNDGSVAPLVSVGLTPMKGLGTMILTSTMGGIVDENDLAIILEPLSRMVDGVMFQNVIKFFMLLLTPESQWNADIYLNDFKRYMTEVSTGYYRFVSKHAMTIEKTLVAVGVSASMFPSLQNSSWWNEIFDLADNKQISIHSDNDYGADYKVRDLNSRDMITYMIPMQKFNILDILTLLSFNFDIRHGEVGYQPNTCIQNSRIFIGVGYGLHNALKSTVPVPNFNVYPANISKILRDFFPVPQHNLDFIILTVAPIGDNVTVAHNIAVAERKIEKVSICLEKITRKNNT